jgi:formate hydrogenlyase subunit 3/multisubunit Na+/H+ antiporter MnhD subunit
MVDRLSWFWIALMLMVPPLVSVAVAVLGWRREEMILGNLAGTVVIFGSALALILRESVVLNQLTRECLAAGTTCWPQPSAFTRYAIYAAIGLLEVMALFLASLVAERRMRRRRYAPEWQR